MADSGKSARKLKNETNSADGKRKKTGAKARRSKTKALTDDEARAVLEASDKLYYRIGEVSQLTGVKAHVLRYWETEFRWMAPPKSRAKQRLYRKRDIEFVWLLKHLLWDERFTIAGARQRIQDLGVDEAMRQSLSPDAADAKATAARPETKSSADEEKAAAGATDATDATNATGATDATAATDAATADWGEADAVQAMLGELRSDLVGLRAELQQSL